MFDPEESSQIQAAADLERLMDLVKLMADPAAVQKKLDELTAATVRATEEKAAAERAKADLSARKAALDRYEARIDAKAVDLYATKCEVDEARRLLLDIRADIQQRGDAFKREILRYAGIELAEHHSGLAQELPDWDKLASDMLGRFGENDPHFADPSKADVAASFEGPAPAPDRVEGSTLTRAPTGSTAAQRRAQRRRE